MQLDALLNFVQPGQAPVSAVGAAGAVVQIGAIIDLLGPGVGVAPPGIIGNTSLWGHDPGLGRVKPEINIHIGTAFATGNAATGEFAIQYAPDTGAAGGYQPGTWEDAETTGFKLVAELAANTVLRMDLPPAPPLTLMPRFMRLIMRPPAATNMNAGTVTFAGPTMARDEHQTMKQYPSNYVVA
jgi:hypothetical protein